MELKFSVSAKIQKPIAEVFDAVYNPKKLSAYFTTGGATGPLATGQTVTWSFHDYPGSFPVHIQQTQINKQIILQWENIEGNQTTVEISFESIAENATLVKIQEAGWKEQSQKSLDESYSHCHGWTQMLCSLKVFVEEGKNLRAFFY